MSEIRLVVLDIEGTTLPIAFVRDVLFPHATRELPGLIARQDGDARIRTALEDVARENPGRDPLEVLADWTARDIKAAPLKTLQGIAWKQGFESGELVATLYPDVVPALRAWRDAGLRLAVYSSGSRSAQRLLYGHSGDGDLTGLFEAFHDLEIGGKKIAESYRAIAERAGLAPGTILFLSDVPAELEAASEAGWRVCQVVRATDGTIPDDSFPQATTLHEVAERFRLPVPASGQ